MRITTRLGVGLAVVAILTAGTALYQLGVIERLRSLNDDLARTHVEAARISLRVVENLEGMGFFAGSYLMRGDPEDRERWAEYERAVEDDLERLADLDLEDEEAEQRNEVLASWEDYRDTPGGGPTTAPPGPLRFSPLPPPRRVQDDVGAVTTLRRIEAALRDVRGETERLLALNEEAAGAAARASQEAAERARTISLVAGAGVLVAAGLVFVLVFASVSGPLRRLTQGTRELARGRLHHRLEVKGRHELADLASDFNHMAERLHELDDLKRDFVSHVSHELKGPLASIHETIEILLEEIPGRVTDKQRDLLLLSRDSSNRLSAMIRNLLEASRLEAGMEDHSLEAHDLEELASSVRRELAGMAADRNQDIEMEVAAPGAGFAGDGGRIREIIANLVGNAMKFSPDRGRIRVRIASVPEPEPGSGSPTGWTVSAAPGLQEESSPSPFLLLEVEDDGPGIPSDAKERIFDKFYRVRDNEDGEETRTESGGVGLGLAISRRIAEAHGADLWVEDAPSGGALFRLLLPRSPRAPVDGSRWRDRERWNPGSWESESQVPTPGPARGERQPSRRSKDHAPLEP